MAEPRRISLISAPLPIDKKAITKSSSDVEAVSTISVPFVIGQPSDTTGPAYDFEKLNELKKKDEKQTELPKNDDPFGEEAEEAKAIKLAKHFEEKYGTTGPRDLRELGAGYDHNDPFVDDAQSAEAMIPPGWTTQHGGYYIGTGPLYIRPFRSGEEKTHVYQSVTAGECILANKNLTVQNMKRKRVVESSGEEDSEASADNVIVKRKKVTVVTAEQPSTVESDGPVRKPVAKTVASMLAERADPFQSSDDDSVVEIEETPTDLRKPKDGAAVGALGVSAGKPTSKRADQQERKSETGDVPIITEDVPDSVRKVMEDLKNLAITWDGGKCNFFSPEHNPVINGLLLKLEWECRQFRCGLRSAVFGHVASYLPCTKETLVKRARKLRQDDVDLKFAELLTRLINAIQNDANGGIDPTSKTLRSSTKKLLAEGVKLKMNVYDLHKGRYPTHEDYVHKFVDAELFPLWKNHAVEKESIYCEALIALGQALRPSSQSSKTSLPISSTKGDFDMPPAIPAAPAVNLSRDAAKNARPASTSRPPVDIVSVARMNTGPKVQYTTKHEIRRDGMKQPSSSGSLRRSTGESSKSGLTSSKAEMTVYEVSPVKPVFLPDKVLAHSKKPSTGDQRSDSAGHRSHPPSHSSSNRATASSMDSMERPSARGRPAGSSNKSHRPPEILPQSDGRRSSKSERHSTHSPKMPSHHTGERPSSASSAGSGKAQRTSSSSKNLPRSGEFDHSGSFSMSTLTSPFVSTYTNNLPLMAGFSPENLALFSGATPYIPGMFPADLASFFSNPAVYSSGASNFSRSAASPPKIISPSSQSDSPFAPRKG